MGNLIKINYQDKTYWGYKKCPAWLRKKLIESRNNKCEECSSTENLEIHRAKRGAENGLYLVVPKNHPLSNCRVLCKKCHQKYNYSRRLVYE